MEQVGYTVGHTERKALKSRSESGELCCHTLVCFQSPETWLLLCFPLLCAKKKQKGTFSARKKHTFYYFSELSENNICSFINSYCLTQLAVVLFLYLLKMSRIILLNCTTGSNMGLFRRTKKWATRFSGSYTCCITPPEHLWKCRLEADFRTDLNVT